MGLTFLQLGFSQTELNYRVAAIYYAAFAGQASCMRPMPCSILGVNTSLGAQNPVFVDRALFYRERAGFAMHLTRGLA